MSHERQTLRAIQDLHKTQVNRKTYASRCGICKTPVPCDTNRLVMAGLFKREKSDDEAGSSPRSSPSKAAADLQDSIPLKDGAE
jgi:hypothetical protein